MSYKRMLSALAIAVLFILLGQSLFAQSAGTGALTGTVTDPSGASVPNVTVTLTNTATGQVRTVTTGVDGVYRFALIPPGTYSVKFTATGFKVAEVPSVMVNVTETPVLNQTLEVGQQAESVVVEAQAAILQTADSTLGTTVSSQQVVGLPLSNRNYTQLLSMAPGAQASVNNATQLGRATMDISVNGVDPENNNYQMDGVSIVNTANTGSANDSGIYTGIGIPNPDAIQEFKIQTSTYDASYGSHPGANVNVVTRSGTNTFHGSAWEFFRNADLNANTFFDNRDGGGKQQIFNQNQFGGDFGGPVKKDKLFFFVNYQGTRQKNGYSGSADEFLFPLPQDRTAANVGAMLCPANHPTPAGVPNPYNTFLGPLTGGQLACDGSNINPVSLALLNAKLPNGQYYIPGNPSGQYGPVLFSAPDIYNENQTVDNVDYVINSKNTFAARFFWTSSNTLQPISGNLPGTPITLRYGNIDPVVKLTTLVTNTFVNEVHVAGQRNGQHGSDTTVTTPQAIGQATIVPTITELPVTVILNGPSLNGSLYPSNSPTDQMQYGDQISWTHGTQTIRAGYEFQYTQWPITFEGLERGFLFYGTFADWLIGRPGCTPGDTSCSVANPGNTNGGILSNILQCLFCVRSGPNGIVHNYVEHNHSAFVQDDWKVSRRLTLNLGVRWEYDGMYSDKYGNLTNIWPSQLATVPVPPTGPTTSGAGLVGYVVPSNYTAHYPAPPQGVMVSSKSDPLQTGPPLSNFGPRVGFAFQPKEGGKLVIRGGFGMFYDRVGGGTFVHGLEQGYPYAITLDYSGAYQYSNQNPYPSVAQLPLGTFASRWANSQTGLTSALDTPIIDPNLHTPLTRSYNLNVQYEFAPRWVLEVGFVGSASLNLLDGYHNINTPLLASPTNPINGITSNSITNAVFRVPYLGYIPAGIDETGFDGMGNYNSLQISVRKQFSHGLTLQASYTWSKDLSTMWETNATGNQGDSNNPSNLGQQYGPVTYNRPNRFIINYAYDLPFGTHKGALGVLVNGWNVSGVTTVQDGTPLTISDQNAGTAFDLGTYDTPRAQMAPGATYAQIATPGGIESRLGGPSGGPGYLNVNAFGSAPAAPYAVAAPGGPLPTLYGNSGVGTILGPGQFNFDISLMKPFKITEKHSLLFRTEFFNAFNHPQFANPGTLAISTAATFGQITAVSVNPRIMQFALKYNF